MSTSPTQRRSPSNRVLLQHVKSLKKTERFLRNLFYPILSMWRRHKLTIADHQFGFHHLDMLRDELDALERKIATPMHRAVRAKVPTPKDRSELIGKESGTR